MADEAKTWQCLQSLVSKDEVDVEFAIAPPGGQLATYLREPARRVRR